MDDPGVEIATARDRNHPRAATVTQSLPLRTPVLRRATFTTTVLTESRGENSETWRSEPWERSGATVNGRRRCLGCRIITSGAPTKRVLRQSLSRSCFRTATSGAFTLRPRKSGIFSTVST